MNSARGGRLVGLLIAAGLLGPGGPLCAQVGDTSVAQEEAVAQMGGTFEKKGGTFEKRRPSGVLLRDVAEPSGIEFLHRSGRSPEKHLPETMGAGVAWLDFDRDGRWDLYLGQSGAYPPDGDAASENRLFRNLGAGRFEDWTARSGAGDRGYAQGVTAADADGDGLTDLYLSNFGIDRLLLNRGDGGFAVVPFDAADGWSSSAAFGDADADGDLDLYVARYLRYRADHGLFCGDPSTGDRRYCDPSLFLGENDLLYENLGDGVWQDVTTDAGLGGADGRGLGVVFTDLDGDFAADLYVANDLTLNLLFRNTGAGTFAFEDLSLLSGSAVNVDGKPEAGMGIAVGDVDRDGDADLLVTNFDVETNTLYENLGELFFVDISASAGIGPLSFNQLAFGVVLEDIDLDGDLDAYVGNGHIFEQPARENVSYRQPDQVLLNDGSGRFAAAVGVELPPNVSRGVAVADFDNDGDGDFAVQENNGPFSLLENHTTGSDWLGVELFGRPPNTAAVGAWVALQTVCQPADAAAPRECDAVEQVRWVTAGNSYQSTSAPRLRFGVPSGATPVAIEVRWPSGRLQRIRQPPSGSYVALLEPPRPTATPD